MEQKKINLKMSYDVPRQKTVIKKELPLEGSKDTSFDIYFDIYHSENDDYLYIKLIENSAVAPFYYNKSFTIEELRIIHRIFNADNIDQVRMDLEKSFNSKKIKLVNDPKGDRIIMEIKAYLFCDECTISLPLSKEMIPKDERNNKLIELYKINKNQIKIGKELYSYLKSYQGNFDRDILNNLKEIFDIVDNSNVTNSGPEELKKELIKIFNKMITANFKIEKQGFEDYRAEVEIKNSTEVIWTKNSIQFKIDKNASTILCKNIIYPIYDIEPKHYGRFFFSFDAKVEPKEYTCSFDVYINGKQLNEAKFQLKVIIPQ
jgi:hypothetical protein